MNRQKQAFTLVELIVTITILAILWTIAFISLQGYSADARDSKRISDVNHIKTSLELHSLAAWKYPLPDNSHDVTWSWTVARHQWTIWDTVTDILSRTLNSKPVDPLYNTEYIYSVTLSQTQYEVMSVYESDMVYNWITKASAVSNTVRIDGNYNWIYVKTSTLLIPTPSIINALMDWSDLLLDAESIKSQVVDRWTNIPNIWTTKVAKSTWWLTFQNFEVYSWTLNEDSWTWAFYDAYLAISKTYNGSSLASQTVIQKLLSISWEDAQIEFTKSLVLDKVSTTKQIVSTPCWETSSWYTKDFYSASEVEYWSNCDTIKATFTCEDWKWMDWVNEADTETYLNESCSVAGAIDCVANWNYIYNTNHYYSVPEISHEGSDTITSWNVSESNGIFTYDLSLTCNNWNYENKSESWPNYVSCNANYTWNWSICVASCPSWVNCTAISGLRVRTASEGGAEWSNAISVCNNLTYWWYSDWYLPNKTQLNQIYVARNSIWGFTSSRRWSSTQYDSSRARRQYFGDGTQMYDTKYQGLWVRCVRPAN